MAGLAEDVRSLTGFETFGVPFCMTVEPEALGSAVASLVDPMTFFGRQTDIIAPACGLSTSSPLENIQTFTGAIKESPHA